MSYNYNKTNWAEDEIIRLSEIYGVGEYIKYSLLDKNTGKSLPQTKTYGNKVVSYPDIENVDNKRLYLLIEVKSRGQFYKDNGYLAMKEYSYRNYLVVQEKEKAEVRFVYLIGDKSSYELFWGNFEYFNDFEKHKEYFQDINDSKSYIYWFFHSSQLRGDADQLFNLFV